jgi:L-aspartate oxidase
MTADASVVRDATGLVHLEHELALAPNRAPKKRADIEDIALTVTARAVAAAALARVETRGCHHRGDHPLTDPAQARSSTVRLAADGRVVVEARVPVGAWG